MTTLEGDAHEESQRWQQGIRNRAAGVREDCDGSCRRGGDDWGAERRRRGGADEFCAGGIGVRASGGGFGARNAVVGGATERRVGKPDAIDMHSHWSPEPYNKALADLGQPVANPYPLDYDLDKRRQWMDDHGDQMHCMTLSGAMPWQRVTAQQGAHLAQVINDAGIQVHRNIPPALLSASSCRLATPNLPWRS